MKVEKHLKTTVYKFVHKSMVDTYTATKNKLKKNNIQKTIALNKI